MTRKTTPYARKRAHADAWERQRHKSINPVTEAVMRQRIASDIDRLRTGAQLHAYTGADAPVLANLAGRLVFIVCHAAHVHGLGNSPEARILAGTANALGDLAQDHESIEKQRATIISGLAAIDRLLPSLHTLSLAGGALELERMLDSGAGTRFLIDFASHWEIDDKGDKPALWGNHEQGRNMDCAETYEQVRAKLLKKDDTP